VNPARRQVKPDDRRIETGKELARIPGLHGVDAVLEHGAYLRLVPGTVLGHYLTTISPDRRIRALCHISVNAECHSEQSSGRPESDGSASRSTSDGEGRPLSEVAGDVSPF
jgi:hypothetical protein